MNTFQSKPPLVIYHNNCSDGFTSAAIAKRYLNLNTDFIAGVYSEAPPDVTGRDVYLLDFSYKSSIIKDMLGVANHIYFIDHHKSAIEDLNQFFDHPKFTAVVDLKRSGAMLTWNYFYPNISVPDLVRYVQDRDIWTWQYSETQAYLMSLETKPFTLNTYVEALQTSCLKQDTLYVIKGELLLEYYDRVVEGICKNFNYITFYQYSNVPIVNCHSKFTSHVGNTLAKKHPDLFSIMYEIIGDTVNLSFRSLESGVDVSEVAKSLGGGGHYCSSGAKMHLKDFIQRFVTI